MLTIKTLFSFISKFTFLSLLPLAASIALSKNIPSIRVKSNIFISIPSNSANISKFISTFFFMHSWYLVVINPNIFGSFIRLGFNLSNELICLDSSNISLNILFNDSISFNCTYPYNVANVLL